MKKAARNIITILFIILLISSTFPAYATSKAATKSALQTICNVLTNNKLPLTCETLSHAFNSKSDLVYGYHEIKGICKLGEKALPDSIVNAIKSNSSLASHLIAIKALAKKNGTIVTFWNDVVLNNTLDLKLTINKCRIDVTMQYIPATKRYATYLRISDIYDFDYKSLKTSCSVFSSNRSALDCLITIANNDAYAGDVLGIMNKYSIVLSIDYYIFS